MWVRMVRPVVAGRQPRRVGDVVELADHEAQQLILARCAVACAAPALPPNASDGPGAIETAEAAMRQVEQAVSRPRRRKAQP